jgi:AraC family transcriptional regulator of adaptative response/methylated-DNA-[protein]-cysteine methyltransferase
MKNRARDSGRRQPRGRPGQLPGKERSAASAGARETLPREQSRENSDMHAAVNEKALARTAARDGGREARDDDRWAAVVARDARADGDFVYAVATTGVYCRPSCRSRRPRPENVAFFAHCEAAEAAGFRPCRRCRPSGADGRVRQIADACRRIDAASTMPDLDRIASDVGMSRSHFQRTFKALTGLTPRTYAAASRDERVRALLRSGRSVTDAMYAAGYNSNGRFYEGAGTALGMPPRAYRGGGAGATVRFAIGECSLGAILVAASETGICAILLGDDPAALARDLEERFPHATLVGADPTFDSWVAHVVGFVEAPRIGLDLPLDVRGTAFQRRVWQALRSIPVGSTVSYAELAQRIGEPRAARAVAAACAANPIAVAIPCHRVVRNDGALSGYRWGVDRKRALLTREAEAR